METSEIGREYHQAGVIYVCSGCETDMLDPGNGADLYLNTAPHPPAATIISLPAFSQDYSMYSTLESNLLSLYSTFLSLQFLTASVY